MQDSPPKKVEDIAIESPVDTSDTTSALEIDERAVIRKIDLRLIPWLSFLYLLNFLDRSSIGNAKLYNLERDIHISDKQYLLALTIFFISYWFFEVPSNIFLKRLRPSVWFSLIMTIWGICMTVQGLVHNYGSLLAVRWLLGMFEAGFYPGTAYYLSCWYKRSEFGLRVATFTSASIVSGVFGAPSGLLAAAINNMDGIGGKPGWAWIFILEGLVTIIAAVASFWIVEDFPDTARFLTEAERAWLIRRMQDDGQFSVAGEPFRAKYVWQSLRDPITYMGMMLAFGYDGPLYAFSLFTPTIINQVRDFRKFYTYIDLIPSMYWQLGFNATPANLLSVPIYVFASILTIVVSYCADRAGNRSYFNIVCISAGMTGYIILVVSRNAALSYFAIYLAAAGIYPTISNSTTWFANNAEGSYKRGVTLAMCIGFGNLQGAITSNIYRAQDRPWYTTGHAIQLGYISVAFISTLVMMLYLKRENGLRERGERDEVILSSENGENLDAETEERGRKNGIFASVEEARREKGDRWSGYRYHL